MATRHSTGAWCARLCSLKPSVPPVPDSLRDEIETERQKLFKESALLECLASVARHEGRKGLCEEVAETGREHIEASNSRNTFAPAKAAVLRGAP